MDTFIPVIAGVTGVSSVRRSAERVIVADSGAYAIPYIQSSPELRIGITLVEYAGKAKAVLSKAGEVIAEEEVSASRQLAFAALSPGEYTLEVTAFDKEGRPVSREIISGIGIGKIIAALGDSITEGYWGQGACLETSLLSWRMFDPAMVSKNRRNFPSFAPTSPFTSPGKNLFAGWLPALNDRLSEALDIPLFIANEGVGAHTSADYLGRLKYNELFRMRLKALRPDYYFIHLGVNDERCEVAGDEFYAHLNGIVEILTGEFQGRAERIFIAYPSFDRHENGARFYGQYRAAIDRVIRERSCRHGPDLWALYEHDAEACYGDDPVHPNVHGMMKMARAWADCTKDELV